MAFEPNEQTNPYPLAGYDDQDEAAAADAAAAQYEVARAAQAAAITAARKEAAEAAYVADAAADIADRKRAALLVAEAQRRADVAAETEARSKAAILAAEAATARERAALAAEQTTTPRKKRDGIAKTFKKGKKFITVPQAQTATDEVTTGDTVPIEPVVAPTPAPTFEIPGLDDELSWEDFDRFMEEDTQTALAQARSLASQLEA